MTTIIDTIFGACYVNGKLYEDDEIATLIGQDIGHYYSGRKIKKTGWTFAGDQSFEESNFYTICADGDATFSGKNALSQLLTYLIDTN